MRYLRFVLIPAVLFLLPGIGQAGWFWQNPLPQGNTLQSVCFIGNNTGYTVGYNGRIFKTTDGGTSWGNLNRGETRDLYSIHFPVRDTGYAVGCLGAMVKTTNGGANWDTLRTVTGRDLYSVHFPVNAQTGYTVGGNYSGGGSTILKTTNGGASWASPIPYTSQPLFSVHFPVDAETGYAVGRYTIFKTTYDTEHEDSGK